MCLDCGCENANILKSNSTLSKMDSLDFTQLKPLVEKIQVGKDILHKNDTQALLNRNKFKGLGLKVFNFMSSPGSGKTTLLCALHEFLDKRDDASVVVGDLETSIDAERLKKHYKNVEQINTVSSCHLDATHLTSLNFGNHKGVLFIENIGNLVCPASFDLGESHRVAVISIAEGEEKPLKYPLLFKDADLCVVTKVDLLPHLDYDLGLLKANIKKINASMPVIFTSSKSLDGLKELARWIEEK